MRKLLKDKREREGDEDRNIILLSASSLSAEFERVVSSVMSFYRGVLQWGEDLQGAGDRLVR